MSRILRIELRRSTAGWVALVLAAVGAFLLRALNPPYESWMQVTATQRDMMQLTWPLALAAGAWQAYRERRSRVEELVGTTPRPRWLRVQPVAAAMALAAAVGYLLMLVGGVINIRDVGGYFSPGAVPIIAIGALAMVAAVLLGLAIGSLLPSPLTAPLIVVVGFLGLTMLPQLLTDHTREPGTFLLLPFLRGPQEGGISAQALSTSANITQLGWLVAITGTGFALFAAGRATTQVVAAIPAVLGVAVLLPVLPSQLDEAWVPDRNALKLVCTEPPQVCVPRIARDSLGDLREPGRQALAILVAKLPNPPTRVVGVVGDWNGRPIGSLPADALLTPVVVGTASAGVGTDSSDPPDEAPLWFMVDGAGTLPCPDLTGTPEAPNEQYGLARRAAAAWLLGRLPPEERPPAPAKLSGEGTVGSVLDALHALPADEQRSRIAAFRAAELTCAPGDRIEILTGRPGSG